MAKDPPLKSADVERGLKAMGFKKRAQKGTAHVHWTKTIGKKLFKVTVDSHLAPFSQDLIKSMARQAGISTNQFYEACSKTGSKKAKKGILSWLRSGD